MAATLVCEPGTDVVRWIYSHLGVVCIGLGLISGAAHVVYCVAVGRGATLRDTLGKVGGGFVLPSALMMGLSAFDPAELLGCVTNLELYIVVGSLSVAWITLSVLFPGGWTWEWPGRLLQTIVKRTRRSDK